MVIRMFKAFINKKFSAAKTSTREITRI